MQWLNDRQPYAFDKFYESNELSPPKLSDVDHEVPNDPQHALYPTSKAWLTLNAQINLYNFSYLAVLTVERFFNLNSESFFVRTKNIPKSIHVNILLPSLIFFSHSW